MRVIPFEPPPLYPKQRAAIYAPERYSLIEASTKAGKTIGCIVWLLEQAVQGAKGDNFWWVAPIFAQAKIAFERMKAGLPPGYFKANAGELSITLITGAIVWFKGADKPDSLYGEDVRAAVIDEASRVKEEAWHAVRSTLTATRGMVRIIGNVKGRKNWFYRLARKAESRMGLPGSNMSFHRLTAYDAIAGGVVDRAEVDDAREVLPEHVFRQLYLAEPGDDEGNPFGINHIRACIHPLSTRPVAAHGVDLAKSQDWCVDIGLDAMGVTALFDRWQGPWATTEARLSANLTPRGQPGPPALVDATGVGDPVVERLSKSHKVEGFVFNSTSKQMLMEGLAVGIQTGALRYPDGIIVAELTEFEYEYTRTGVRYSAPEGYHDDAVCALALAWHKLQQRPTSTKPAAARGRRTR